LIGKGLIMRAAGLAFASDTVENDEGKENVAANVGDLIANGFKASRGGLRGGVGLGGARTSR